MKKNGIQNFSLNVLFCMFLDLNLVPLKSWAFCLQGLGSGHRKAELGSLLDTTQLILRCPYLYLIVGGFEERLLKN